MWMFIVLIGIDTGIGIGIVLGITTIIIIIVLGCMRMDFHTFLALPCNDNHIMAISDELPRAEPISTAPPCLFLPARVVSSSIFSFSITFKMYCLLIGACG